MKKITVNLAMYVSSVEKYWQVYPNVMDCFLKT